MKASDLPEAVMNDLVTLHLAGEASPQTSALVDEYLAAHPALTMQLGPSRFAPLTASFPSAAAEVTSLTRTRRRIALERWVFGLACAFTAVALSIRISTTDTGVSVRPALIGHPGAIVATVVPALALWSVYVFLRRRRA